MISVYRAPSFQAVTDVTVSATHLALGMFLYIFLFMNIL